GQPRMVSMIYIAMIWGVIFIMLIREKKSIVLLLFKEDDFMVIPNVGVNIYWTAVSVKDGIVNGLIHNSCPLSRMLLMLLFARKLPHCCCVCSCFVVMNGVIIKQM